MTEEHDQARLSLGAYVLGALEAPERDELEAHLGDCPECREELVALGRLPSLLAGLDEAGALAPSPDQRTEATASLPSNGPWSRPGSTPSPAGAAGAEAGSGPAG
ncbi:MAG: anti-sigma factor family protein, partial [Acidimicrobiales bacterium]